MSKDFEGIAKSVLAAVGGKSNVVGNMACMTRLRVKVVDSSRVDEAALKQVDGVMGLVADGDR